MVDPFNWPMPKRADLMSLSTLGQKDVSRVKTANYAKRIRDISNNLNSLDIHGKISKMKIWFRCTAKKAY